MVTTTLVGLVLLQTAAAAPTVPGAQMNVVYQTVESPSGGAKRDLALDFYPAQGVTGPAPLVLVFHGGAWIQGRRQEVAQVCEILSRNGFASATVSYRLAPRDKWPAQINDAREALRFFRRDPARFNVKTDRVAVMGFSAGAHLALLLGAQDAPSPGQPSAQAQVVLNVFGPTDMSRDFNPNVAQFVSQQVLGKPYDPQSEELKSFSPFFLINSKSAPTFTIHGDVDEVVPVPQARHLDEAMKKAGVPHELRIIPGMGHAIPNPPDPFMKALDEGIGFVRKHLSAKG